MLEAYLKVRMNCYIGVELKNHKGRLWSTYIWLFPFLILICI